MSNTEIINEEPIIDSQPTTSEEEKFFGKTMEVDNTIPEDLSVEIIDDVPPEDRRPPRDESVEEVEIDDDTLDAEITDYSKRAGDRINKLKYDYHEERRAKEQATRESQEAIQRLSALMEENKKLQALVDQGGEVLNKQAANNALWAKQNAQAMYKSAYEAGDADKMAEAQEQLSKAVLAEQTANNMSQQVQTQILNDLPVEETSEQKPQQIDEDLQRWAAKNPWFMGTEPIHKEMSAYAMYVDNALRTNGIDPAKEAEKYYAEVDKEMRNKFPNFFGIQQTPSEEVVETKDRQPQTVVAGATRNTGNSKPSQVRLTQTQVKIARQLGISPEQYANQLLKEQV